MSRTYIPGIVENIKAESTPYTPIIEAITNSIDAIIKGNPKKGLIKIYTQRETSMPGIDDDTFKDIVSVRIEDNGIGFNNDNKRSFDTVYSPQKKELGGKGFGRFFFLRHFTDAKIQSVYKDQKGYKKRQFEFGKQYDVVVNESVSETTKNSPQTTLELLSLNRGKFDKDPEIFAHRILEQLLSYFADENFECPEITIYDEELLKPIVLNQRIGKSGNALIQLKKTDTFKINDIDFNYKMFKLLHPRNQKSKIVLTARNQAVTHKSLDTYVPEFASDFTEDYTDNGETKQRNYIVQFYIKSDYLDMHVRTERDTFDFGVNPDPLYPVSETEIEQHVADIAKRTFGNEVKVRFEKKREKVEQYANDNVWYRPYLTELNLDTLKMNPSNDEIESSLHIAKYKKDKELKSKITRLASDNIPYEEVHKEAENIVAEAKQANVSELAHYVAFRRSILELFKKTIKFTEEGKYKSEKEVHDLIFPTKSTSKDTTYDGHNLWILDERLTFTQYISSDKELFKGKNKDRPDIAAFNYSVAYRDTNESYTPISIFEFKKPGRYDFANLSSDEDPYEQIKRYVLAIKNGEVKTIDGLEINVGDNTPFYGYIVADSDKKIRDWLKMQDFSPLPEGQGWFYRHKEMNLYIEYISWQKLIKDAEIRHRKFFELLGVV